MKKLTYHPQKGRADYVYKKYGEFLGDSVLDVGCRDAYLRKYIKGWYIGVDIAGKTDIFINLEKEKLPFKDNSFSCVICTDVLEHLDNIHDVFFELERVSKRYVIISLPNNWDPYLIRFLKGRGSLETYGLPLEKPQSRHKWFFNYEDAEIFIRGMAKKANMKVLVLEPYCPFKNRRPFINLLLKIIYKNRYNNLFAMAIWAVLEKDQSKQSL